MFTLKIVRSDGTEELVECTHVGKERNGLLVQHENATSFRGPAGMSYALDCSLRDPNQNSASDPRQITATAYVMNRFGATVATYYL